jgi:N-acetyl-anhydromuramyl-L-alanine amidase AmpD
MEINNVTTKLKTHSVKKYSLRDYTDIDTLVIHHSATRTGSAESYANYHVLNRNWAGIGYHFVIEQNGEIKQTNHVRTLSYHARGVNKNGIGICLTGNYDEQTLPGKMLDSLVFLIKELKLTYQKDFKIIGHREVSTKTCPGKNVSIELIKKLTE